VNRAAPDIDMDTASVTVPQLAELLGVGSSAIMKYAREAGLPRGERKGRYPLKACIQWALARAKSRAEEVDESKDIIEERRKLIVEQRKAQELANAETRGELLAAGLVGTTMNQMLSLVATQLDGLAARVTPRVVQLRDPAQVQRVLFDECRLIRNAAARAVEDFGSGLGRLPDPEPAPQEERRRVGRRAPRAAPRQPGAGAVED
jgi:phage terminase Nu1 subunit (DNA packaging protein)